MQKCAILEGLAGVANMDGRRQLIPCLAVILATLGAATLLVPSANADNFGNVYYDKKTDRLIVTMVYRGSNPNHKFSLRWGDCKTDQSVTMPTVTVEVLDDQFEDDAQMDFRKTTRFSLAGLPCSRPASVTLRTAPRFYYTLTIPG
jgi:hypothetical protein